MDQNPMEPEVVAPPPPPKPPTRTRRAAEKVKRFIMRLVTVAVVGSAIYYAGWFQGRGGLGNAQQKLTEINARLQLEQERGQLMYLRGILFQCVLDVHEENFGTARTRLQTAAGQLAKMRTADSLQVKDLRELAAELSGLNLSADLDHLEQQQQILDIASRLEAHVPAVDSAW